MTLRGLVIATIVAVLVAVLAATKGADTQDRGYHPPSGAELNKCVAEALALTDKALAPLYATPTPRP